MREWKQESFTIRNVLGIRRRHPWVESVRPKHFVEFALDNHHSGSFVIASLMEKLSSKSVSRAAMDQLKVQSYATADPLLQKETMLTRDVEWVHWVLVELTLGLKHRTQLEHLFRTHLVLSLAKVELNIDFVMLILEEWVGENVLHFTDHVHESLWRKVLLFVSDLHQTLEGIIDFFPEGAQPEQWLIKIVVYVRAFDIDYRILMLWMREESTLEADEFLVLLTVAFGLIRVMFITEYS